MNSRTVKQSGWTGMVPVEDTALAVTDTGGSGRPVVYLNGSYASQRHWQRVIAELGTGWRHITYDERDRGKSKSSADYSFDACLRDLDAVLTARQVDRPLLVGWSYGALLAVYWAARHPDRVLGVVGVDGPYPWGWTDEAGRERVRKTFRRMRWMLPLISRLGLAARMSAEQHADIQIEAHELHAALAPVYDRVSCPVRIVQATGASMGGGADEFEQMRASLDPILAAHPNVQVAAKATGNHQNILSKDFRAIAEVAQQTAPSTAAGALGQRTDDRPAAAMATTVRQPGSPKHHRHGKATSMRSPTKTTTGGVRQPSAYAAGPLRADAVGTTRGRAVGS